MGVIHDGTDLVLESNSTATKGKIRFGDSCYDEPTERLGLHTTSPSFDLSFGGAADVVVGMEKTPDEGEAGKSLSLVAGPPLDGEADQDGGTLVLSGGSSTGTGDSKVLVATAPAGTSGTQLNVASTALEIRGDGTVLAGRQGALLAQGSTTGFLLIPAVATGDPNGTPSGVPTGLVPLTFCPVTGKLAVWDGSAWKFFSADA